MTVLQEIKRRAAVLRYRPAVFNLDRLGRAIKKYNVFLTCDAAADADADADADVAAAFPVVQTRPRKFPNGARKSAVSRWNSKRARAHFVTPTDANRVDSFATVE